MEKYDTVTQSTDYSIIRRMRFACCITKATDTHSEYVILIALSMTTLVTRTRHSVAFIRILQVLFWMSVRNMYLYCVGRRYDF